MSKNYEKLKIWWDEDSHLRLRPKEAIELARACIIKQKKNNLLVLLIAYGHRGLDVIDLLRNIYTPLSTYSLGAAKPILDLMWTEADKGGQEFFKFIKLALQYLKAGSDPTLLRESESGASVAPEVRYLDRPGDGGVEKINRHMQETMKEANINCATPRDCELKAGEWVRTTISRALQEARLSIWTFGSDDRSKYSRPGGGSGMGGSLGAPHDPLPYATGGPARWLSPQRSVDAVVSGLERGDGGAADGDSGSGGGSGMGGSRGAWELESAAVLSPHDPPPYATGGPAWWLPPPPRSVDAVISGLDRGDGGAAASYSRPGGGSGMGESRGAAFAESAPLTRAQSEYLETVITKQIMTVVELVELDLNSLNSNNYERILEGEILPNVSQMNEFAENLAHKEGADCVVNNAPLADNANQWYNAKVIKVNDGRPTTYDIRFEDSHPSPPNVTFSNIKPRGKGGFILANAHYPPSTTPFAMYTEQKMVDNIIFMHPTKPDTLITIIRIDIPRNYFIVVQKTFTPDNPDEVLCIEDFSDIHYPIDEYIGAKRPDIDITEYSWNKHFKERVPIILGIDNSPVQMDDISRSLGPQVFRVIELLRLQDIAQTPRQEPQFATLSPPQSGVPPSGRNRAPPTAATASASMHLETIQGRERRLGTSLGTTPYSTLTLPSGERVLTDSKEGRQYIQALIEHLGSLQQGPNAPQAPLDSGEPTEGDSIRVLNLGMGSADGNLVTGIVGKLREDGQYAIMITDGTIRWMDLSPESDEYWEYI